MTRPMRIGNQAIREHAFLQAMYGNAYFPRHLVDKCRDVLLMLCESIEQEHPQGLDRLYFLSHAATEQINQLEDEFLESDSEIETAAREALAQEFEFVARCYGFAPDVEELIAPRNW